MVNETLYPVFVVGSGRSGTTVLYQRLCADTDVAFVPAVAGVRPELIWPVSRIAKLVPKLRAFQPSNEATGLFDRVGLGSDAILANGNKPLGPSDMSDKQAAYLRGFLASIQASHGAKRAIIIKNTGATARVDALSSVVPESRFVHIVRDGRGVAASLARVGFFPELRLWWDGRTASELVSTYGSLEEVAIEHWSMQVKAACASLGALDPARVHQVRYDELVQSPDRVLGDIRSFIGPELATFKSSSGFETDGISASSLDVWRERISQSKQERMWSRHGQLLREFGYER